MKALPMVNNAFGPVFAYVFFNYLISGNLSDTFINKNITYASLIIANPLQKRICRSITSAIWKQIQFEQRKLLFYIEWTYINCLSLNS